MKLLNLEHVISESSDAVGSDAMNQTPSGRTDKHDPMSHGEFFELVYAALGDYVDLLDPVHATWRHGDYYLGLAEVKSTNPAMAPFIGWRQAHDGRLQSGLFAGLGVRGQDAFVVGNHYGLGSTRSGYKSRMLSRLRTVIHTLVEDQKKQADQFRQMHDVSVDIFQASYILNRMMLERVYRPALHPHILRDWITEPSEQWMNKDTLFRLVMCVSRNYTSGPATGKLTSLTELSPELYRWAARLMDARPEWLTHPHPSYAHG